LELTNDKVLYVIHKRTKEPAAPGRQNKEAVCAKAHGPMTNDYSQEVNITQEVNVDNCKILQSRSGDFCADDRRQTTDDRHTN
jgi:hypothetical protein